MGNLGASKSAREIGVQEILEKYRKSGRISIEAKRLAQKICKPGALAYDICQQIEACIRKEGAIPAFPVNISINHEAAHYSAEILDTRLVPENSIVKIDLGAHIDGYMVDTALTINFDNKLDGLAEITEVALDNAIDAVKPGVKVSELGRIIEKTITDAGFEPVRNLSGHQIKRYVLHAGVSIPNCGPGVFDRMNQKLEAGRIYAIEPFASTGQGWIKNDKVTNIFRYVNDPKSKDRELMKLAKEVKSKVGVLPFSPRHLHDPNSGKAGKEEVTMMIRKLKRANVIMGYPVLIEDNKSIRVSQHEHTVRVTNDGCEVFTKE